jgi:hypothetical protein
MVRMQMKVIEEKDLGLVLIRHIANRRVRHESDLMDRVVML